MASRDPEVYKTLLDNLSDGVMVIDFDGSVRMANPALCRIFGLEPEQVVGRLFADIFVAFEGFDEFVEIVLDAVVDQGDIKRRIAGVHSGAESRSLSVTTSYLTAAAGGRADRVAVIAVVSDITEVKELRETELRMAKVVENQLAELQKAYRDIETRNEELSRMMKQIQATRGAAVLLVAGLFLAIGAWYVRPLDLFSADAASVVQSGAETADLESLPTVVVEPGELRATLTLRGQLAPGRVVEIVSPVGSHVRAVHTQQGQEVAAGDALVDLDTGQLAVEYRRAQVGHIQARDKLVDLEDWENSAEMSRARRALRRAKIALDDAERHLKRTVFLLEQGIVPASEHEEALQRRQSRKLDFEEAERELDAVKAQGGEEAKRVARLEVENARVQLRTHEEKLNLVEIKAPIAGVIVAADSFEKKPLTKGSPVAQGELLLSIADLERISVAAKVDEADVRKIEVGQPAAVTGPGFPGLEIEGTVTHVSSRAKTGKRERDTPSFEIIVDLGRLDADARARLRVGMSAHVEIVVHSRSAALLVPLQAVEQSGGKAWLRVVDRNADALEKRAVELGLTTLDSVEVVAGVSAGEEIVLSPR